MPIQRRATEVGIFDPAELALLGRVFDKLKVDDPSTGARDAIRGGFEQPMREF